MGKGVTALLIPFKQSFMVIKETLTTINSNKDIKSTFKKMWLITGSIVPKEQDLKVVYLISML